MKLGILLMLKLYGHYMEKYEVIRLKQYSILMNSIHVPLAWKVA